MIKMSPKNVLKFEKVKNDSPSQSIQNKSIINRIFDIELPEKELQKIDIELVTYQYITINKYYDDKIDTSKYIEDYPKVKDILNTEIDEKEIIEALSQQIKALNHEIILMKSNLKDRLDQLDNWEKKHD
jgi:uncharacterized protein YktA (UPF0223 family)